VYIIAPEIKSQEDFRKRSRDGSQKMRFANENAGKKDQENF
jgi:hypothetical protein